MIQCMRQIDVQGDARRSSAPRFGLLTSVLVQWIATDFIKWGCGNNVFKTTYRLSESHESKFRNVLYACRAIACLCKDVCVAMELVGVHAVQKWAAAVGPSSPSEAFMCARCVAMVLREDEHPSSEVVMRRRALLHSH
eukprot:4920041-Amphidinium_carterae.1